MVHDKLVILIQGLKDFYLQDVGKQNIPSYSERSYQDLSNILQDLKKTLPGSSQNSRPAPGSVGLIIKA